MIHVAILTFNRLRASIESVNSLIDALHVVEIPYRIYYFDDGSDFEVYAHIIRLLTNLSREHSVVDLRQDRNIGYNRNLSRVLDHISQQDVSFGDIFYIHESDMILDKRWFKFLSATLTHLPESVVTPLHHIDHFFDEKQRCSINSVICPAEPGFLDIEKFRSGWLMRLLVAARYEEIKAVKCYGTVGTFGFGIPFWKILSEKIDRFPGHEGKEDAFISYLAHPYLYYSYPGLARIHEEPGLHGDMSICVASFQRAPSLFRLFCKRLYFKFWYQADR
jgi:hypothetical protein